MHSLKRYDWILHLFTLTLCSYFLAQAGATYVGGLLESLPAGGQGGSALLSKEGEGEAKKGTSLEDYQVIASRNIFNSSETAAPETTEGDMSAEQLGELGPAVKTSLEIKVLSTLAIGEGTDRRSSVVISGGKNTKGASVYFPGDAESFEPNVRLTKVAKGRIEFVNRSRLEYAEIEDLSKKSIFLSPEEVFGNAPVLGAGETPKEETPGGAVAEKSHITVDQKELDESMQHLDQLMTEIRIVPNFKDGRPAGMKVLSVKPGSVIGKLGIQRGDILEKVNGQELDIKRGMELFTQMKDVKNFSLEISRRGKNQTFEYDIR